MKFEKIVHESVNPDGAFQDQPGAVKTEGSVIMSQEDGGCDVKGCKCSEGHWLSVFMPRTKDGIVEGVKVTFDNWGEMQLFLSMRDVTN